MTSNPTDALHNSLVSDLVRSPATWIAFGLSLFIHTAGILTLGYLSELSETYSPSRPQYARGELPGELPLDVTVSFITAEELQALTHRTPQPPRDRVADIEESVDTSSDTKPLAHPDAPESLSDTENVHTSMDQIKDRLLTAVEHVTTSLQETLAKIESPSTRPEQTSPELSPPTVSPHSFEERDLPQTPHEAPHTGSPKPTAAASVTDQTIPASRRQNQTADPEQAKPVTPTATSSVAERVPTEIGIETGAEVIDLPKPNYPMQSRRLGEEGLVVLEVEVLPNGRAGQILVIKDPGHPRLVQAAINAVRDAQFTPANRDGHPVRARIRIPFKFKLK